MQIEGRAKIGLHLRGNDSAPDVDWVGVGMAITASSAMIETSIMISRSVNAAFLRMVQGLKHHETCQ